MLPSLDQLICTDDERRDLVRSSTFNGIDYIEVPADDQRHIRVFFLKDPVPVPSRSQVEVLGGVRVQKIEVVADPIVATDPDTLRSYLEVTVDQPGDFSIYALEITLPALDSRFQTRPFSFKAGCRSDIDCLDDQDCPPELLEEPVIDYMAKDYAGFRRLLLDLASTIVPEWTETRAADVGTTLVELLAYHGDYLSYHQDAAANEMHLETARRRESVSRHVRLIDYPMHQGLNARTFIHLEVGTAGDIPAAATQFLTRVSEPVDPATNQTPLPMIANAYAARAADLADIVFESVATVSVDPDLNRIWFHAWGDDDCCLLRGATTADLVGTPPVQEGDLLLIEEVKGVGTGLPQDADRDHRQVVRLVRVELVLDLLMTASAAPADFGVKERGAGDPPLAVTRVWWHEDDALTFPVCLSTMVSDRREGGVSVARGNVVAAHHGRRVQEAHTVDLSAVRFSRAAYRFRLRQGPLSYGAQWPDQGRPPADSSAASLFEITPATAVPLVSLVDGDGVGLPWGPFPDLLNSDRFSRGFVAEPDGDGRALVRFGDGDFGMSPDDGEVFEVTYRIGNGRSGNVGPDTLVHAVEPAVLAPGLVWPQITSVRNAIAAHGGVDPEPLGEVKRIAPDAFRAETFRAVTPQDYAEAAEKVPGVSNAIAAFRWTGSWYTVFVTIDPRGTDELGPELRRQVREQLTGYKQAGYDLEIRRPVYVSLKIDLEVCAAPDHFRADVRAAVADRLSARRFADGTLGFFHPDNFTFGQSLYLSELYAAVEAVPGVDSALVTKLQRFGKTDAGALAATRLDVGPTEIVRLANDPSFPEHGVLRLEMKAGK